MGQLIEERKREFEAEILRIWSEAYEAERRAVRELAARGRRMKAEAGGLNGCAPVGYVNRRRGDRTWVEVDPVMGPLVKEAFELASTGKYSLRKLLVIMTHKGLRSRNGKPLSPSSIHYMLSNPFYYGLLQTSAGLGQGLHPALVSTETSSRVVNPKRVKR